MRILSDDGRVFALISHDCAPINPRAEYDHVGTIVYRRESDYALGNAAVDPDSFILPPDAVSLPVYAYIHSVIELSTVPFFDAWDSGQSGYIYAARTAAAAAAGLMTDAAALRSRNFPRISLATCTAFRFSPSPTVPMLLP